MTSILSTYSVFVTGVPVNIHLYLALMYDKLMLDRVELHG